MNQLLVWGDAHRLRDLSKDIMRKAAASYDKNLALLAVISYVLSKFLSKTHFRKSPKWPRYKRALINLLEEAEKRAREGDRRGLQETLNRISVEITKIDAAAGNYVMNIMEKGRVKMASEAYALGLSVRRAAELTDAPLNELYDYIGKTRIHDEERETIGIKRRLKVLEAAL